MAFASKERDPSHRGRLLEVLQTLDIPLEEPKAEVFSSFLNLVMTLGQIISSEKNSPTDERFSELIDVLISTVPNKKFKEDTRRLRNSRIDKEALTLSTNEDIGRKIKQINREIFGEVYSYMDRYAGGEQTNRISFVIPVKEIRDIMTKRNPEHFIEHLSELKEETVEEKK